MFKWFNYNNLWSFSIKLQVRITFQTHVIININMSATRPKSRLFLTRGRAPDLVRCRGPSPDLRPRQLVQHGHPLLSGLLDAVTSSTRWPMKNVTCLMNCRTRSENFGAFSLFKKAIPCPRQGSVFYVFSLSGSVFLLCIYSSNQDSKVFKILHKLK